jgi:hypothetical protein
MARLLPVLLLVFGLSAPLCAAPARFDAHASLEVVQKWIYNYRLKPDPAHVPAAVRILIQFNTFKDQESSGIYLGFIAGALGADPTKAEELVARLLPIPPEDQWVLVRAIAFSGLPDWKGLLAKFADRMPTRKVMIDDYLAGKLPILREIPLEEPKPTFTETMKGYLTFKAFSKEKAPAKIMTFDQNQELLDVLWGYYFASGSYGPILRILTLLPWSKDRDSVDKLTIGSMAEYTLATYAVRDWGLRDFLKTEVIHQPSAVATVLREVIEAADTVQTARIRKAALGAVEELKLKGSDTKRDISFWGQVGVGTVALGCVVAGVLGKLEVGIPCVVGGSVSQGLLSFREKQQ